MVVVPYNVLIISDFSYFNPVFFTINLLCELAKVLIVNTNFLIEQE
jgi:hypothetical protein